MNWLTEERRKGNKLRKKILERDNNQCVLCGFNEGLEVHHMHALYLGGKSTEDNLITLCEQCHIFAPETGTEANKRYLKYRNKVALEQMMNNPEIYAMVTVAYTEFLNQRIDEYVKQGFINEEQKEEILFFETNKVLGREVVLT